MPTCDIIMPVYNNAAVLPKTLHALYEQQVPEGWIVRLIASDDGSVDESRRIVEQCPLPPSWLPPIVCAGEHQGSASARNHALERSDADIVFFLGADIVLRPNALALHLSFHSAQPSPQAAALGIVMWDPLLLPTPLMEWLVHGGTQNDFDEVIGRQQVDPAHFMYGSHMSLKRKVLVKAFEKKLDGVGWEDLELGRRLSHTGLHLYVLESAVGLHHHAYSARDIHRKQIQAGRGLVVYQSLHSPAELLPDRSFKKRVVHGLFLLCQGEKVLYGLVKCSGALFGPTLWRLWTTAALWKGVYSMEKELKKAKK